MTDIDCTPPPPGGLATDPLVTYLEVEAAAAQAGLVVGVTPVTAVSAVVIDQDPADRVELLPSGAIRIRESGFYVVDWSVAVQRTSVAIVNELMLNMTVNTTEVSWDALTQPLGASQPANGCMYQAPVYHTLKAGIATWFNRLDVIAPSVTVTGPGSVTILANNDPVAGNGPSSYLSVLGLGPGVDPYRGSVWP